MKKPTNLLAVLFLVTICFTSCKSDKEFRAETLSENRDMIIQSKLEKSVKSKLKYPDSYQFVELRTKDSVLYSDNVKHLKNYYKKILEADKKNLAIQESYKKQGSSKFDNEKLSILQNSVSKNQKILEGIDRVSNDLGDKINETASYTYNYAFKSKNISGKDASYNYIVQTSHSPEYTVLNMAEKEDMIIKNPNDFPGYKEMLKSLE